MWLSLSNYKIFSSLPKEISSHSPILVPHHLLVTTDLFLSLFLVVVQLLNHVILCNHMACQTTLTPGVCPNSLPLNPWCSLCISSSATRFSIALSLSQHQGLFHWVGSLHQAKVLELPLQHQSSQWIFRVDFLQDGLIWSPCSPRDSRESSPASQFKSISSSVLRLLYGPTLTFIHDYWKNQSFDYKDLCGQSDLCFLNTLSRFVIAFLPRSVSSFHGFSHCLKWFGNPKNLSLLLSL